MKNGETATDRLRGICMALPEAHEQVFGGHTKPTWRVRGKIVAMMSEHAEVVNFKGQPGAQSILVEAPPGTYFVPQYVGHRGRVAVRADAPDVDWDELANLLYQSWSMTAPKSLQKA